MCAVLWSHFAAAGRFIPNGKQSPLEAILGGGDDRKRVPATLCISISQCDETESQEELYPVLHPLSPPLLTYLKDQA